MKTPKYQRVLLKLSGEALAPSDNSGILDFDFIARVAEQIKRCTDAGVQVGVIQNIVHGINNGLKIFVYHSDHHSFRQQ